MDIVALRLLFVVGLVALGVLAALLGIALTRLVEHVRSLRRGAAPTSGELGTNDAHPGARGVWFERSAARQL